MTGYTRQWNCRICKEHQETIDNPKEGICDKCIFEVAKVICASEIGKLLTTPGIDEKYWMRKASFLVGTLMQRWVA